MNHQEKAQALAVIDEVLYAQAMDELSERIENLELEGTEKKDGEVERKERFRTAVVAVLKEAGLPTDSPPEISSVHRIAHAKAKIKEIESAKYDLRLRTRALEALKRPTEQVEEGMARLLRTEEAVSSYMEEFAKD